MSLKGLGYETRGHLICTDWEETASRLAVQSIVIQFEKIHENLNLDLAVVCPFVVILKIEVWMSMPWHTNRIRT